MNAIVIMKELVQYMQYALGVSNDIALRYIAVKCLVQ